MPGHVGDDVPQVVQVAAYIAHAERAGGDFDEELAGSGFGDREVAFDDEGFAVLCFDC